LDEERTSNAIAISGTAFNALRVTRTGRLSHWKGLAYPNAAFGVMHATFLARVGITGPLEVFEGNKGFKEAIAGQFEIDWSRENLERVTRTVVKRYNAEVHSQSALEGILELKKDYHFSGAEVTRVDVDIFDVAYNIIGGGEEGNKTRVQTKEQADHSLQYMLAVAILDDKVMPEQYERTRIVQPDVQGLLRKITVRPSSSFSKRFPREMPCRIKVHLQDGRILVKEKKEYEGFYTRRMRWETVVKKFEHLIADHANRSLRDNIVDTIAHLEKTRVSQLMRLLRKVR
jgi:2-methylcitrate dehydratase